MSRQRFEERHAAGWDALAERLDALDARKPVSEPQQVVEGYRQVCHHLALARHRQYGVDLVARLNRLALRGHRHLYGRRLGSGRRIAAYALGGFARDVRRHRRGVALATLLLFGPLLALLGAVQLRPELAQAVLDRAQLAELEAMYDPATAADRAREADADVLMFGFYVRNNVGVAFRTFAGGIFLGLGSAFFLSFNGVFMGAAAGHLTRVGYGETFWPFVIGHGAFELTAIVLAGATGLKLGGALLQPRRRSRRRALVEEARDGAGMVYGFAVMLVIAALLEAFWSPARDVPSAVKLWTGAALWALVGAYFLGAGRREP